MQEAQQALNLRERLFFGQTDMTAWRFAGTNTLSLLSLYPQREMHGRWIQQSLLRVFGGHWTISNDVLYNMLNSFEQEGYLFSRWQGRMDDPHKRHLRAYRITDKGMAYLHSIRGTFVANTKDLEAMLERSLYVLWDSAEPQSPTETDLLLSSALFTEVNLLNLLAHTNETESDQQILALKHPWLYARQIRDRLSEEYLDLWKPSDGLLYPKLSMLDTAGLVQSRWAASDDTLYTKKRTVREYRITETGAKRLDELLSPSFGLKNRLIGFSHACRESARMVGGNPVEIRGELASIVGL